MSDIDIADLREKAERMAAATAQMIQIGAFGGGLGVHHPDMLADYEAWISATDNEHADTVLGLLDEIEQLRELVSDFASHGVRFDLNPTIMFHDSASVYAQMSSYVQRIDQSVRERAAAALEAARQAGGTAA